MQTIEIDFDVFKEITARRKNEGITPNDVLRELLVRTDTRACDSKGSIWKTLGCEGRGISSRYRI